MCVCVCVLLLFYHSLILSYQILNRIFYQHVFYQYISDSFFFQEFLFSFYLFIYLFIQFFSTEFQVCYEHNQKLFWRCYPSQSCFPLPLPLYHHVQSYRIWHHSSHVLVRWCEGQAKVAKSYVPDQFPTPEHRINGLRKGQPRSLSGSSYWCHHVDCNCHILCVRSSYFWFRDSH